MFSTQTVCDLLGITKSTLIRWEREGRVPKPRRTLLGYRTHTLDDVKILLGRLSSSQAAIAKEKIEQKIEKRSDEIVTLTDLLNRIK